VAAAMVDHPPMPTLSIMYQLARCLVGLIAVSVRRDLSKDAQLLLLRHETAGAANSGSAFSASIQVLMNRSS
jgi:hypothetical protein